MRRNNKTKMKRIFISAGDPSGDRHAANFMSKVLERDSNIEFVGIGGVHMSALGFKSLVDISDTAVVGFWEVAKKYTFFKRLLNECHNYIKNNDIDLFIPVDYPGFNLRLAEGAKKNNVKVLYYIAPQVWAWGKKRIPKIKSYVDKLLCVLPFEEEFFKNHDINAEFIGHPMCEDEDFIFENSDRDRNLIALLPGSRTQEISRHSNLFSEIITNLKSWNSDLKFGLAIAPHLSSKEYNSYTNQGVEIFSSARELMKKAQVGIVKTGTSTLESALLGLPHAMIYKTSAITYFLGKSFVDLEHISLPNILLGKTAVKEFIQKEASPESISAEIKQLLTNQNYYNEVKSDLGSIREILGSKSASENVANTILEIIA
jgi:lipid-A-disaccharide synthase